MKKYFRNSSKKSGFTLIELLVVIAVIGILMSLALVSYQATRKSARDAKRKADIQTIAAALEAYKSDHGNYPYGSAGSDRTEWEEGTLDAKACCQEDDQNIRSSPACSGYCHHPLGELIRGGYLSKLPIDPGVNYYINGAVFSGCANAQFYSYKDHKLNGAVGTTYLLSAVEESKGTTNCLADCAFTWNRAQGYQYCITNP